MKVILDTCALIWLCGEPDRLPPPVQKLFKRESHLELCLSDDTILEIALKSALKKIELPGTARKWVQRQVSTWDIQTLSLSPEVLFLSAELPWHHRDPFDRLIIATAKMHDLPVVTADSTWRMRDLD